MAGHPSPAPSPHGAGTAHRGPWAGSPAPQRAEVSPEERRASELASSQREGLSEQLAAYWGLGQPCSGSCRQVRTDSDLGALHPACLLDIQAEETGRYKLCLPFAQGEIPGPTAGLAEKPGEATARTQPGELPHAGLQHCPPQIPSLHSHSPAWLASRWRHQTDRPGRSQAHCREMGQGFRVAKHHLLSHCRDTHLWVPTCVGPPAH